MRIINGHINGAIYTVRRSVLATYDDMTLTHLVAVVEQFPCKIIILKD